MTLRMIALAAAFGLATAGQAAPPAAQATTPPAAKGMNFDCTKAGNKNKAACKSVTTGGVAAAPKPAAAAVPATQGVAASAPKNINYDCTKAGNKNKQVCKNVVVSPATVSATMPAAAAMPVAAARASANAAAARTAAARTTNLNEVAARLKNGKVVHYDCSKAGNKNKKACSAK